MPAALGDLRVEHAVGGDTAESVDYTGRLHDRVPLVIGFVLLLTMVTMGLTFRSAVVAVLSSALNLLSVGVAFGGAHPRVPARRVRRRAGVRHTGTW